MNSLTWDIWFSLINNNLVLFRLAAPLLQNFSINWLLPSPLQSRSPRVTWDPVSQAWSPNNSHGLKRNSQLLGCKLFFLSQHVFYTLFSHSVVSNSSATPWTIDLAPLTIRLSKQEYWSGVPFPSPGDLPARDWTQISCVSCIGRQILYHPTTWEAHISYIT